ncbi:methylamine dehydrogenase accessory protein MauD [Rhizorhabdus sp. FW153]|uniref:methylamine dehydrogenase accessory protein MauD n=1 Tax=Rhizorhabdus sp. FW153 TaxID=3400216 RepID=UPI003CFAEA33
MIIALSVAIIVQWILILALCTAVLLLFRQVGMLHERLGPVGALTLPGGVAVGDHAPRFDLEALDGRAVALGGQDRDGRDTLLFFLSPRCSMCKSLIPIVKSIAREETASLRVVLASDGDEPLQRAMIADESLEAFPLVLSTDLGMAYAVSKLPYAVLIKADGHVAAKGLVNNREHLESLFEARRRGVASLQEFLEKGRKLPKQVQQRTVA